MALNPRTRGPRRTIAALIVVMIVLFGGIAAAVTWASAQWTPKLGLDLEGGTEMTLEPVLADPSQQVNQGQLDKARDIISQRVDSYGVAEAEVTTQGGRNIVVSIPGTPDAATLDAIRKPSQLRFRSDSLWQSPPSSWSASCLALEKRSFIPQAIGWSQAGFRFASGASQMASYSPGSVLAPELHSR